MEAKMRTRPLALVLFLAFAAPCGAQRQAIIIDATKPEGRMLQQITEESDDAKKVALMEQFVAQYPTHPGAIWISAQMVGASTKAGQFDKALAAAEKVLAQDPSDLETAFAAVKAAEAKKDPDTVRKWAVQCSELARKTAQAPKAGDEDDDAFKQRVAAARQIDNYTEYALFASAGQASDLAKRGQLLQTLEERAPKSSYLTQAYPPYFLAMVQSGDAANAVALAEKLIARGQGNELMLATAGDFYLRQNKEPQKVLDYSSKLIDMLNTRPKPEGVAEADWQKSKGYFLGWGQWIAGVQYCSQAKFAEGNKLLREALPLLEGNDDNKAGALYNLGIANSHLKNMGDALKFFEQCSQIKSPYQPNCADSLKAIRARYRVVK